MRSSCCLCWLIVWDLGFISYSRGFESFCTELVPFTGEIIVALEDQASRMALQSMLYSEAIAAAIASCRKVLWLKADAMLVWPCSVFCGIWNALSPVL